MKSEARRNKIYKVLSQRQPDVTLVLENIHDPHNVSAIFRSADAIGVEQIQLVYTKEKFPRIGKKSSSSANKWVTKRSFISIPECYEQLRKEGFAIYATSLNENSKILYDINLTEKIALVFGNEHSGVSEEAAKLADGTMIIPMMGMIQSLNVSVACAVTLYEVLRQRLSKGDYNNKKMTDEVFTQLYDEWLKK